MRDIKFRAFENGVMYQQVRCGGSFNGVPTAPTTWNEEKGWLNLTGQPHTKVMQFTGLNDKDGIEIYEGDIVQLVYGEQPAVTSFDGGHDVTDSWTKEEVLEVKFVRGSFVIGEHLMWALEEMPFDYSLKVIGNIYQDQELTNQN